MSLCIGIPSPTGATSCSSNAIRRTAVIVSSSYQHYFEVLVHLLRLWK